MSLRFVIVGSGWRSLFYARIAAEHPELFHLEAVLCRNEEKVQKLKQEYGLPATMSEEECEAASPDFVVVAVSKPSICEVTLKWAGKGYPVLCETPAALTQEDLCRIWKMAENGAKIQVAEQYFQYPMIAAALEAVRRGYLGDPYAVNISLAHDYHGASLIRRFLNLDVNTPVKLYGKRFTFPVMETGSRAGDVTDGSIKDRDRIRLTLEFDNGKAAFYDFSGVQYHSYIRSRHLNVQGINGELDDLTLRYTDDKFCPVMRELEVNWTEDKKGIRSVAMGNEVLYENPFSAGIMPQDETAIAALMMGMKQFIEDGTPVYPLADALQDAYTLILMNQALEHPGEVVKSDPQIWQ